jgi:hypothetical protein
VELVFNTHTYSNKMVKSADIQTNDLTQPSVKISFSVNIQATPDTAAPFGRSVEQIELAQKADKQVVTFTNRSDSTLHFVLKSPAYRPLEPKNKDIKIKPHQTKNIDFSWKGDFPEADSSLTVTYAVTGSGMNRFTIPVTLKGTKPPVEQPKPTLKESAKPATTQPPNTAAQQPTTISKWPASDTARPPQGTKQ